MLQSSRRFYGAFYRWCTLTSPHTAHQHAVRTTRPLSNKIVRLVRVGGGQQHLDHPKDQPRGYNVGARDHLAEGPEDEKTWLDAPPQSSAERPFDSIAPWEEIVRYKSAAGIMLQYAVPTTAVDQLREQHGDLNRVAETFGATVELGQVGVREQDGQTIEVQSVLVSGSHEEVKRFRWELFRTARHRIAGNSGAYTDLSGARVSAGRDDTNKPSRSFKPERGPVRLLASNAGDLHGLDLDYYDWPTSEEKLPISSLRMWRPVRRPHFNDNTWHVQLNLPPSEWDDLKGPLHLRALEERLRVRVTSEQRGPRTVVRLYGAYSRIRAVLGIMGKERERLYPADKNGERVRGGINRSESIFDISMLDVGGRPMHRRDRPAWELQFWKPQRRHSNQPGQTQVDLVAEPSEWALLAPTLDLQGLRDKLPISIDVRDDSVYRRTIELIGSPPDVREVLEHIEHARDILRSKPQQSLMGRAIQPRLPENAEVRPYDELPSLEREPWVCVLREDGSKGVMTLQMLAPEQEWNAFRDFGPWQTERNLMAKYERNHLDLAQRTVIETSKLSGRPGIIEVTLRGRPTACDHVLHCIRVSRLQMAAKAKSEEQQAVARRGEIVSATAPSQSVRMSTVANDTIECSATEPSNSHSDQDVVRSPVGDEAQDTKENDEERDSIPEHKGTHSQLAEQVRFALRTMTHPVALITSIDKTTHSTRNANLKDNANDVIAASRGVTVSSFTTITLHPTPIVSFNLKLPSRTWDAIKFSRKICVHLVASTPKGAALVDMFTRPYDDPSEPFRRLAEINEEFMWFLLGNRRRPVMIWGMDVLAVLRADVDLSKCVQVGDHVIVVAKVGHARLLSEPESKNDVHGLAYANRRYRALGTEIEPASLEAIRFENDNTARHSVLVTAARQDDEDVKRFDIARAADDAAAEDVDAGHNPATEQAESQDYGDLQAPVGLAEMKVQGVVEESQSLHLKDMSVDGHEADSTSLQPLEADIDSVSAGEAESIPLSHSNEINVQDHNVPPATDDNSAVSGSAISEEPTSNEDAPDYHDREINSLWEQMARDEEASSYDAAESEPPDVEVQNQPEADEIAAQQRPDKASSSAEVTDVENSETTEHVGNAQEGRTSPVHHPANAFQPSATRRKKGWGLDTSFTEGFSTWARSTRRHYSSYRPSYGQSSARNSLQEQVSDPNILSQTVASFLGEPIEPGRKSSRTRLKSMMTSRKASELASEKIAAAMADGSLTSEESERLEGIIARGERYINKRLALAAARDLRYMLDTGNIVHDDRVRWMESAIERGLAVLLEEAKDLRRALEEKKVEWGKFEEGKRVLEKDYAELDTEAMRLRQMVDEDADGDGPVGGFLPDGDDRGDEGGRRSFNGFTGNV